MNNYCCNRSSFPYSSTILLLQRALSFSQFQHHQHQQNIINNNCLRFLPCCSSSTTSTIFSSTTSSFSPVFAASSPCFSGERRRRSIAECNNSSGSRRFVSTTAPRLIDNQRDFYQVLGVPMEATPEQIKKAFYTACKKYHPDVVGSNQASAKKFVQAKEAFDTLMDEQKRLAYNKRQTSGGAPARSAGASFAYDRRPPNPTMADVDNHLLDDESLRHADAQTGKVWKTCALFVCIIYGALCFMFFLSSIQERKKVRQQLKQMDQELQEMIQQDQEEEVQQDQEEILQRGRRRIP